MPRTSLAELQDNIEDAINALIDIDNCSQSDAIERLEDVISECQIRINALREDMEHA